MIHLEPQENDEGGRLPQIILNLTLYLIWKQNQMHKN